MYLWQNYSYSRNPFPSSFLRSLMWTNFSRGIHTRGICHVFLSVRGDRSMTFTGRNQISAQPSLTRRDTCLESCWRPFSSHDDDDDIDSGIRLKNMSTHSPTRWNFLSPPLIPFCVSALDNFSPSLASFGFRFRVTRANAESRALI